MQKHKNILEGICEPVVFGTLFGMLVAFVFMVTEDKLVPDQVLGAPTFVTYQKSLIPITDDTYDLGTTTNRWKTGFINALTVSSCTGCAGASADAIATSTNETAGRLSYWTTTSGTPAKLGDVATTTLTVSGFPANIPATLGALVGGSNTTWTWWGLSTTTALTQGQLLYNTTGGNGVSSVATTSVGCSGFITCTGFDALGAASTITTTGQLALASGGTNASLTGANQVITMNAGNTALTSEAAFSYVQSTNLLSFDFASTTAITASGEMVVPQNKTLASAGEVTTDDTTGQWRWFAGSQRVSVPYYPIGFTFSTTTPGTGTTTRYLTPARAALTVNKARCESNTFYQVSLYDGTNRADLVMASSTIGTFTYTTNNTFTANESMRVDVGTTTAPSGVAYLSCGFDYTYTAD